MGAKFRREQKKKALGLESLCLSLLEHSCSSRFEGAYGRGLIGTIDSIGTQILQELEYMEPVQEDAAANRRSVAMMRAMLIMMETRISMLEESAVPLEASVVIAKTHANTLELHVLHHQMSVGAEGFVGDVFKFEANPQ